MSVEIEGITKRYGEMVALDCVSAVIPDKSFVTFLGPSGCGKTTLLRILAGLIQPDGGRIVLNGREISSPTDVLPPEQREMGMVFQGFAVWPHMSVFENVAYGLRIRKVPKHVIAERVAETLALVQLTGLESRYPKELSGGQQQRVALARSVVVEPRILLLDEPLSNLDAKLREEMRTELREIQRRVGIGFVYVTHDQDEALSISDQIVVMNGGRIEQAGTAQEIYEHPETAFVAGFVGTSSTLRGRIVSVIGEYGVIDVAGGERMRCRFPTGGAVPGAEVEICVRPSGIAITDSLADQGENVMQAEIKNVQYFGDSEELVLQAGSITIRAMGHPGGTQVGQRVRVRLDPDQCLAYPIAVHDSSRGDARGPDTS